MRGRLDVDIQRRVAEMLDVCGISATGIADMTTPRLSARLVIALALPRKCIAAEIALPPTRSLRSQWAQRRFRNHIQFKAALQVGPASTTHEVLPSIYAVCMCCTCVPRAALQRLWSAPAKGRRATSDNVRAWMIRANVARDPRNLLDAIINVC